MTDKIIFFSRFASFTKSSGGGPRRTHQVLETIKELGNIEVVRGTRYDVDPQLLKILNSRIRKRFLKNYVTNGDYKLWNEDRQKAVYNLRTMSREWAKNDEGFFNVVLAVVEDPIYFKPLVLKLNQEGIPVVAVCHNIESLSYQHKSFKKQQKLFSKELDILSKCQLAISISREETILLNSFGINVFYFPYYPPSEIEDFLLETRTHRQHQKKENFILLGNTGNLNTRLGMYKIIEYWNG